MKHINIIFFLSITIISLCCSCKKESENCIITGQLLNCDGTPYANKVATMVKNVYGSSGTNVGSNVYTDGQGEFEYLNTDEQNCYYELIIESRRIITGMISGNNYRLNAIHINPSINVVLKVKAENQYNSDYRLIANTPAPESFAMYGPFKDTIIGQYNIDILNTINASINNENGGKIDLYLPTKVSYLNSGVSTNVYMTYETYFASICPQSPDTIILIIK